MQYHDHDIPAPFSGLSQQEALPADLSASQGCGNANCRSCNNNSIFGGLFGGSGGNSIWIILILLLFTQNNNC